MAISKITLNGITQMDVTQKTVTDNTMLDGVTSLKNDGTDITGSIQSKTSSDLTVNGATVTAPAGNYASSASASVASGTAGTPTATKGTVSNHSVTVTPSITNATGYITGGTKTGTGVSVSAAELVSGSETFTHNGTFDVTNLASIVTDFFPSFEYETGFFTPTSDVSTYNISFAKTHYWLPFYAFVGDVTNVYDSTTNTNAFMLYQNWQRMIGVPERPSSSSNIYGQITGAYRGSSTTAFTNTTYASLNYSDENTGTSSSIYPRFWVTPSGMKAYIGSSTMWRSNRTYKWIAIWVPELNIPWEIGSISATTGGEGTTSYVAKTSAYIPVDPSVNIYLSNNAQVALRCYNSNKSFMPETSSWLSSDFNLSVEVNKFSDASSIAYVRFIAHYPDNSDITDIQALANSVGIRGIV